MESHLRLMLALGVASASAACASNYGQSEASLLYNYCINNSDTEFLDDYNAADSYKAMTAGIRYEGDTQHYGCSYVGQRASAQEAVDDAMSACRENYPACYVVARGGQLEDWALAEQNGGASGGETGFEAGDVLGALAVGIGVTAALAGAGAFDGGETFSAPAIGAGVASAMSGAAALTDSYDAESAAAFESLGNGLTGALGGVGTGYGGSYGASGGGGYSQRGAFEDCAALYAAVGDYQGMAACQERAQRMGSLGGSGGGGGGSCPPGTVDVAVLGGPTNCVANGTPTVPPPWRASDISGL